MVTEIPVTGGMQLKASAKDLIANTNNSGDNKMIFCQLLVQQTTDCYNMLCCYYNNFTQLMNASPSHKE